LSTSYAEPTYAKTEGAEPFQVKWVLSLPSGGFSRPAFSDDGRIFLRDWKDLIAVSPEGTVLWRNQNEAEHTEAPAVGTDGTVYCPVSGGIAAYSPEGIQLWQIETGFTPNAPPVATPNGGVVLTSDNELILVDRDGETKWRYEDRYANFRSATVNAQQKIVAYASGGLVVLDAIAGDAETHTLSARLRSDFPPVLGPDGTAYLLRNDWKAIVAMKPGGELSWIFEAKPDDDLLYGLCVAPDGSLRATYLANQIIAVSGTGHPLWEAAVDGMLTPPATDSLGVAFLAGIFSGVVYAIGPTGDHVWKFATDCRITSSPCIAPDDTVFVCGRQDSEARLYAIGRVASTTSS
jgi:hypothetical protein